MISVNSQVGVTNEKSDYKGRAGVVRKWVQDQKNPDGYCVVELDATPETGGETVDFLPAELRVLLAG